MRSAGATFVFAAFVGLAAMATPLSIEVQSRTQDEITFYKDVLPILQQNCQTCHRDGGGENIGGTIAPMSLVTYDEVRPWARSIRRKVESREMPPWFATDHTKGVFYNERGLTDAEIAIVSHWESAGAPAGRSSDAPAAPLFNEENFDGWTLGQPDLVVSLPEPYLVEDDVNDKNIQFDTLIPESDLPEGVWVQGIEFKAGSSVVHHICAAAIPADRIDTDKSSGAAGESSLGCIAPGAESRLLPAGHGFYIPKGATIRFNMHYHKEPGSGTSAVDESQIAFIFNKTPVEHKVVFNPIPNNGFEIPPGHANWKVGSAKTFEKDTTILALWPHAHLRAVASQYWAFYPDGTKELLLDVPKYDQDWQTTYKYTEPKQIPAGTRLEVLFWYDNTPERAARREFDSARAVKFGTRTVDEMMLGYINYTDTEPQAADSLTDGQE